MTVMKKKQYQNNGAEEKNRKKGQGCGSPGLTRGIIAGQFWQKVKSRKLKGAVDST